MFVKIRLRSNTTNYDRKPLGIPMSNDSKEKVDRIRLEGFSRRLGQRKEMSMKDQVLSHLCTSIYLPLLKHHTVVA